METDRDGVVQELKWKKFPVLNDGFVCLVDVMGTDEDVVRAARVSYGNDVRNDSEIDNGNWWPDNAPDPQAKEKSRTLLRYLRRHYHTTPFEMCELKFLVRVPMDCWRQWIRHRTASVNEYSTRYSNAIDSQQKTKDSEWRLQAESNKQGSSGVLGMAGGSLLTDVERQIHKHIKDVYEQRLGMGIAKEQARKDLPLSTYTEAYWKINLHNLLHFLSLRMDSHAQKEIRDYAVIIGEQIVARLFPLVWEAFNDYDFRRGGLLLSRLDVGVVQRIVTNMDDDWPQVPWSIYYEELSLGSSIWPDEWRGKTKCRERDECIEKLKKLGLVVET